MERHLVWVWLGLLLINWAIGLGDLSQVAALQLLGSAIFFGLLFLLPLFKKSQLATTLALSSAAIITALVFSISDSAHALIIFTYLAGEVIYRLTKWYALSAVLIIAGCLMTLSPVTFSFSVIYTVFLIVLGLLIYSKLQQYNEADARYDALIHEYRKIKLKSASDEKLARQEERTQIGREIHDRVGHKLTNLLMQLEVARMEVGTDTKERFHMLKGLAKESLEETRQAVKAMDHEEIGGLPSIIRLIRKLEAENFIRIQFAVKNRAFSAELDVDQTVAVYRAVQEALTNVMRHSLEREASVLFESPGESVFRFEVSNPVTENYVYHEGYGLQSMRERIKQVQGRLEILTYQNRFIIRGTLPLKRGSVANDARVTS
ncbi:sensor histidine kinase [Filobacillus milosensis]|uniref:histidine kinase n=1 Tax=Filobacillus milosensis TaxID=94137 RepID=A0A4Y8IQU9_9BACI|nr:histidine kinase [Filobacillus milosensis]TFB22920.1 sensor histidine kinase [Filobacillus milosensis]